MWHQGKQVQVFFRVSGSCLTNFNFRALENKGTPICGRGLVNVHSSTESAPSPPSKMVALGCSPELAAGPSGLAASSKERDVTTLTKPKAVPKRNEKAERMHKAVLACQLNKAPITVSGVLPSRDPTARTTAAVQRHRTPGNAAGLTTKPSPQPGDTAGLSAQWTPKPADAAGVPTCQSTCQPAGGPTQSTCQPADAAGVPRNARSAHTAGAAHKAGTGRIRAIQTVQAGPSIRGPSPPQPWLRCNSRTRVVAGARPRMPKPTGDDGLPRVPYGPLHERDSPPELKEGGGPQGYYFTKYSIFVFCFFVVFFK